MKKILIILLMMFLFCNTITASGQTVSGWEIAVDRPFYFVGDNMTVQVTGIEGMNYSLDMVNSTTWMPTHLTTRGIGPSGIDRFSVILSDEWVIGGQYYLNVSIDGFHMAHRFIRIEYSEEYLHQKEHDWVRDSVAWIERAVSNIYDDLGNLWSDVQMVIRTNFVLMVLVLVIGGQVFLHVMIPVFYAWARKQQFRGAYKIFRLGCAANQTQWHDLYLPDIPTDHRPNVKTLAQNCLAAGLMPEQGKAIVTGITGSAGDGDFVKDKMNKIKWGNIKLKAVRKLKLERGVAGAAYIELAHKEYQKYVKKVKALGKMSDKELENNDET